MPDWKTIFTLMHKEVRDAQRNRWFMLYALAFAALSLALAWLTLSGAGAYGLAGFGRTSATLINLILLIIPLMGLTLGALGLATEREKGALAYLLAQPITYLEMLLGKFLGLGLALLGALALGFGLTGALMAVYGGGGEAGAYLFLLALSFLLALAALSLGFLLSAASTSAATAVGLALFAWLVLTMLGDLGLMGTAVVLRLDVHTLFWLALANPMQLFKIAAIASMQQNLEVLGPAGIYALRTYGAALLPLLVGLLLLWVAAPFVLALRLFQRRGVL